VKWLDRPLDTGHGLCFVGTTGVGKTTLACRLVDALCRRGNPAYYLNWPLFLAWVRQGIDTTEGSGDALTAICNAPVLVLDDLGREKPSEWTKDQLYVVMERRYSEALPTIVTTNETTDAWDTRFGAAVASRLHEMCQVVPMVGQDMRKHKETEA
jgi:DNA replication protein DnaC